MKRGTRRKSIRPQIRLNGQLADVAARSFLNKLHARPDPTPPGVSTRIAASAHSFQMRAMLFEAAAPTDKTSVALPTISTASRRIAENVGCRRGWDDAAWQYDLNLDSILVLALDMTIIPTALVFENCCEPQRRPNLLTSQSELLPTGAPIEKEFRNHPWKAHHSISPSVQFFLPR